MVCKVRKHRPLWSIKNRVVVNSRLIVNSDIETLRLFSILAVLGVRLANMQFKYRTHRILVGIICALHQHV